MKVFTVDVKSPAVLFPTIPHQGLHPPAREMLPTIIHPGRKRQNTCCSVSIGTSLKQAKNRSYNLLKSIRPIDRETNYISRSLDL